MPSIEATPLVVVVGAGLAGLTAAYELQQAGLSVLVLEAQDRVGGRVYTARREFAQHQYCEAGGEFIDSQKVHPRIHQYINRFGLALQSVDAYEQNDLYYFQHQKFTSIVSAPQLDGIVSRDLERFWRAFDELGQLDVNLDDLESDPKLALLDSQSVFQWLEPLALHPLARAIIDEYLRSDFDDPQRISLLALAHDAKLYSQVPAEEIECYRIKGGNSQLPEAMAAALQGAVRLQTAVTGVSTRAHGITIHHLHGEVNAHYLILATPFPALRQISFSPELPPRLQQAIRELNYSRQVKFQLQYRHRFWRNEGLSGTTLTDLPLGRTWEASEGQEGSMGILTAYTDDSATLHCGVMTNKVGATSECVNKEWMQSIVTHLEEIYPDSQAQLVTAKPWQWHHLPYFGGAFTCYAPGQLSAFWSVIRQAHGQIYFAGEHTDIYWGYMEGAIRSGQRVAQEIITKVAAHKLLAHNE